MDISFQYRFHSNTTVQVKDAETESATSKESIAQTTEQPPAAPTMAPTIQPSTAPEADQADVNKSESAEPWQNNLEKDSIDKEGSKPDMKSFSKESIAQTTEQQPAEPTMAPTIQPSTAPEADQVDVNKSESADSWQNNLEKDSIDKEGSKPDMKSFKDEVEEDAVVAENEADRVALLHEVTETKENKTEDVFNEEGSGVIYHEETPSDSEVLNVSPPRPRPKLVTPFRGRCPVCRKYFLGHSVQ